MNQKTSSDHELCIGFTTVGTAEDAETLARGLVDQRLAACVQINGPIQSVYHWEGQIQSESEYRVLIKTQRSRLPELREWINEHHPYDEPQWLVIAAIDASTGYSQWVRDFVGV